MAEESDELGETADGSAGAGAGAAGSVESWLTGEGNGVSREDVAAPSDGGIATGADRRSHANSPPAAFSA